MKVCMPTGNDNVVEGIVKQYFGKAPTYTIMDTDKGNVYVIANESDHMGGVELPPEYLHKNSIEIMLCGGSGIKRFVCLSPMKPVL